MSVLWCYINYIELWWWDVGL